MEHRKVVEFEDNARLLDNAYNKNIREEHAKPQWLMQEQKR
jgi:hypothetical protein